MLDVEYKMSLHQGTHEGRWNINKDKGAITFNLPLLFRHSKEQVTNQWIIEYVDGSPEEEEVINHFIMKFIEVELIERICIERAYQKIKIKGGRCKPICHVEGTALLMVYPDHWDGPHGIRSFWNDQKRLAGIDVPITADKEN